MTKRKTILIGGVAAVILSAAGWFLAKPESGEIYTIRKGNLETIVECKGDIKGEKYTEINMPDVICDRELYIYELKIVDMIAEGKQVKKGDFVARLDESRIMTLMRDQMQEKEKADADLKNAVIDSTVTLTQKREAITNARLDLEYNRIDLEQSKYESGAYQRKAHMSYQKAEMQVEKLRRDYLLEKNRLKMQVARLESRVKYLANRIARYQQAMASTTIRTPQDGIVMFAKDWQGKTLKKDSEVSIWMPLIATLPDMSVVISEAYVKEIDVSRIKINDPVRISIDALPDKKLTGKIIKIATIGEDHKDFDMKAFKVVIRVDAPDKDMKPGMTANNQILVGTYQNQLLVPLSGVFTRNGVNQVYVKKGGRVVRKIIRLSAENDEFGVVQSGLDEGDKILLYQPEKFDTEG